MISSKVKCKCYIEVHALELAGWLVSRWVTNNWLELVRKGILRYLLPSLLKFDGFMTVLLLSVIGWTRMGLSTSNYFHPPSAVKDLTNSSFFMHTINTFLYNKHHSKTPTVTQIFYQFEIILNNKIYDNLNTENLAKGQPFI